MTPRRFFWAVAVGGIRAANGFGLVILVGLLGSLLGWIEGHPALTVPLVGPLVLVLIFENIWLTGKLRPISYARAGGAISLLVLALVGSQLASIGTNGLLVGVFAVLSFAALLAVTALIHPAAEGF
ncbi:MAG: hypothetical protein ACLFM0_09775 [Spirochaetales bacterium]